MAAAFQEIPLSERRRGWTSLHEVAAHPSELRRLEEELKNDAVDVNQQTLCGETALGLACRYKSDKAMKPAVDLLLHYGADANISDKESRTPLMHATLKGNLHVVATLLNSGHADPDLYDSSGRNAILVAAVDRNWGIVECLLQAGASVLDQNGRIRILFVSLAASHGQSGCLEKLIQLAVEKGQKEVIDWHDLHNCTPLMVAAMQGHVECLQVLLKHGANPNLKMSRFVGLFSFFTALHFAVFHNHAQCIKPLLDKMDQQQLVQKQAGTIFYVCPLQLAVKGRKYKSLEMLLKVGFPVNNVHRIYPFQVDRLYHFCLYDTSPPGYQTSLSFAAALGDVDSAKILLDYGASVNPVSFEIHNEDGVEKQFSFHPALSALCCQKWKALDLLIEHGCDICYEPTGISPVECLLLSFYDFNSTKKLLMRGSDPHLIFQHENDPSERILHYLWDINSTAGQDKFLQIFELLLQFTAISGPVQRFFHDTFEFVTSRNTEASVSECYSKRMKAILQQVNNPSSLEHLCRIKIRQSMISVNGYSSFIPAIHRLCLPEMLKEYLLYSEINKERESTHDWMACSVSAFRKLVEIFTYIYMLGHSRNTWTSHLYG